MKYCVSLHQSIPSPHYTFIDKLLPAGFQTAVGIFRVGPDFSRVGQAPHVPAPLWSPPLYSPGSTLASLSESAAIGDEYAADRQVFSARNQPNARDKHYDTVYRV